MNINDDPVGIGFVMRTIRVIIIVILKILFFPIRVLIYYINPLNVKRVKIINHDK